MEALALHPSAPTAGLAVRAVAGVGDEGTTMTVSTLHPPPPTSGGVATTWIGAWAGAVLTAVLGTLAGLLLLLLVSLPPDLDVPPFVASFFGYGGLGGPFFGAVAGFLTGMGLGGRLLLRRRGHAGAGATAWLTVAVTALAVAGLYLWGGYLRPVTADPLVWPYLAVPLVTPVAARGLWLLLARRTRPPE